MQQHNGAASHGCDSGDHDDSRDDEDKLYGGGDKDNVAIRG